MENAVVLAWLKREGDAVEQGTPLVEVETDKATFVVEAEVAGTLAALQVKEGETVLVRDPLAPACRGAVELEENVLIGVGAVVNSTVRIGSGTIVTPGSAVMNDVPADVVVSGVPARVMGKSRRNA